MPKDLATLSLGTKLILLLAGHISLNSIFIEIGKEAAFEMAPGLQLLFLDEVGKELWAVALASLNTFPLTLAMTWIVSKWKKPNDNRIFQISAALWLSMFIGSWLHLGLKSGQLALQGIVPFKEYLLQGNALVQILTYPIAVFFQTYGFIMFFTSILAGYIFGKSNWQQKVSQPRITRINTNEKG